MRLGRLISLRPEVGGSGSTLREEAGEYWMDEGAENNLGTTDVYGQSS